MMAGVKMAAVMDKYLSLMVKIIDAVLKINFLAYLVVDVVKKTKYFLI